MSEYPRIPEYFLPFWVAVIILCIHFLLSAMHDKHITRIHIIVVKHI